MKNILSLVLILLAFTSPIAISTAQAEKERPKVFFIEPQNGATVGSPVKVKMGVSGIEVKKAGEIVKGTGHHHLIIDSKPVKKGTVVPADKQHIHFGDGQTETEVELEPGTHTLTLQFANGAHLSYGKKLSSTITIEVK